MFREEHVIADIGSGTGILSELLAQRNSTVICVEPNDDMLRVAKKRLAFYKKCKFILANAENTLLDDNSIDYITVAQAFHWFDRKKFKAECKRILKKNGKVVLVWNSTDNTSPINFEITQINERLCSNFNGFSGRNEERPNAYSFFFLNGICDFRVFKNDLLLDEPNFVGRNLSRSYAPVENDLNYDEYVTEMKSLFKKYSYNGKVLVPNSTRSYIGNV